MLDEIEKKKKVNVIITNVIIVIIEYAWIHRNKQDSEYACGPKYTKILNMGKFWIRHGSQYASVTQRSEYAKMSWQSSKSTTGSKHARFLNMLKLHRFLNMPWLNMSE